MPTSREGRVDLLIREWYTKTREVQHAHYACMRLFSRLHLLLGIPGLALSTAVGTAVISSLEDEATSTWKIFWGLLSVLAAVLTALQTFLGLAERAEKHRQTGAGYGAVRRQLELLKTFPTSEEEDLETLRAVKDDMDELAKNAPELPASIVTKFFGYLAGKERESIFEKAAHSGGDAT